MPSYEPLRYPPDFPPASKWKRFFMGVRWLGPDTSFFGNLRRAQNARSPELMEIWGGGERQTLASALGVIFSRYCNWPSPYFMPEDNVSVIAGGCTFGWLDNTDMDEAIEAIEDMLWIKMAPEFWETSGPGTIA